MAHVLLGPVGALGLEGLFIGDDIGASENSLKERSVLQSIVG